MQEVAKSRRKKCIKITKINDEHNPCDNDSNISETLTAVSNKLQETRKSRRKKCNKMYICESCHYYSDNKYNYDMHIKTKKHLFCVNKNIPILIEKFTCLTCKYESYRLNDYNKHLLTKKHIHIINNIQKNTVTQDLDHILIDKNIFIEIIKNNTEFKELVSEQNKTIMEQNNKLNKMLENGIVNNISNTNCNNNNKTFNLQFFLNEQCKDALNMIDFINSLQFNPGSVEYTGKHGYVEGMMKLIMDGLKELDVYKRPIHCTDLKRDILYIKEENKWEKDTEEKNIFNNALHKIVQKNIQQIRKWREENPRCEIMETKEYEFHFVLMQQCIGGGTGQQEPNNKKILKNIAKYVLVDRNIQ